MLSSGIYTTLVYYFSDRRLDQLREKLMDLRRLRVAASVALSTRSDRGQEVVASKWFRKKAGRAGAHG
jgi:hypothetical protein